MIVEIIKSINANQLNTTINSIIAIANIVMALTAVLAYRKAVTIFRMKSDEKANDECINLLNRFDIIKNIAQWNNEYVIGGVEQFNFSDKKKYHDNIEEKKKYKNYLKKKTSQKNSLFRIRMEIDNSLTMLDRLGWSLRSNNRKNALHKLLNEAMVLESNLSLYVCYAVEFFGDEECGSSKLAPFPTDNERNDSKLISIINEYSELIFDNSNKIEEYIKELDYSKEVNKIFSRKKFKIRIGHKKQLDC